MNLNKSTSLIWLITNVLGTTGATCIAYFFEYERKPEFMIIIFCLAGSVISIPAIIFTRLNFQFIKQMKASPNEKYFYTVVSTFLFISAFIYFIMYLTGNGNPHPHQINKSIEILSVHILTAVLTTLFFARPIINTKSNKT